MDNEYPDVITRFLRDEERLILSTEKEMPLVIEAQTKTDLNFLQELLNKHSKKILADMAKYGAVLLRGFAINSDLDFEKAALSIRGFRGISEAFMSEEGRVHVDHLNYVLFTNAVYKTGGTLYLGGFHTENYYTPDVPGYICFCCHKPSLIGGETGLINTETIYRSLDEALKKKLEKKSFFVCKWLLSEVALRYKLSEERIEKLCKYFDLPILGEGKDRFILMYKPSVFEHPLTKEAALQVNLFEIAGLNKELRKCFMADYQGKTWFWHRFVWKMPASIFHFLELIYMSFASFFHSPKESLHILSTKFRVAQAEKRLPSYEATKVGSCFTNKDIKALAAEMRKNYCSFLWKKGDLLLVDNRKAMHAGMPGAGPRLVRALISNPIAMNYSSQQSGYLESKDRETESIGFYMLSEQEPSEQTGKIKATEKTEMEAHY